MTTLDLIAMVVFALASLGLAHTYLFYPLGWWLVERWNPRRDEPDTRPDWHPSVSLIVAAHNEELVIGERVRNALATAYSLGSFEAVIGSDGSNDQTVARAKDAALGHPNVVILDLSPRRGKVNVLNDAVAASKGDVLVFSDANVAFEPDAISALVNGLRDLKTGCVCGLLKFRIPKGSLTAQSEGLYWRLETWLKQREGGRGMLLGANGAIFAIRRELWLPCPPDTVVEDFFIPMRLLRDGWRVMFEPSAVAWEDAPSTHADEFARRIRIGAGDYQALSQLMGLLDPRKGWAAWVFFSHKVLRWLGPFSLIALLITNCWLAAHGHREFQVVLVLQALAYAMAAAGVMEIFARPPISRVCAVLAHFVAMNVALLFGFWRWLTATQRVTWHRTPRSEAVTSNSP